MCQIKYYYIRVNHTKSLSQRGNFFGLKVLCVGMSELKFILSHLEEEEMLRKLPVKLSLLFIGLTEEAQFYNSQPSYSFVT